MSCVPNIMFTAGDHRGRKGGKWYRQKRRGAKYSKKRKYRTIMLDRRKDRQRISPWSHTTGNAGQGVHPPPPLTNGQGHHVKMVANQFHHLTLLKGRGSAADHSLAL